MNMTDEDLAQSAAAGDRQFLQPVRALLRPHIRPGVSPDRKPHRSRRSDPGHLRKPTKKAANVSGKGAVFHLDLPGDCERSP